MISVTLLSTAATATVAAIAAQNGYDNDVEVAYNEPYAQEYTKDKGEEYIETEYIEETENEYEVVEEAIVVTPTQQERITNTNNAPPRNNSAPEYVPAVEVIEEQYQAQPQVISRSTYMDASAMLSLINNARAEYGLEPLVWSDSLTANARVRAHEITVSFSHTRPDGRAWHTVGAGVAGENIAARQRTIEVAFRAWMNSPSHRENILRPEFRTVGIAGVHNPDTESTYHWVQLFGR